MMLESQVGPAADVVEQAPSGAGQRISDFTSRIKVILGTEERVSKATLRELCGECNDREFGLALHQAREQIRRECKIEFVPSRTERKTLVRASTTQKFNRADTFRGTAIRKMRRVGEVLNAIDTRELGPEEQQRLQMAQDKNGMTLMRVTQVSRMRKPLPVDGEVQPGFPGRPK